MKNEILNKIEEFGLRFDQIDKRFDGYDKRFDGYDRRFDEHDKRFDQVDKRFDEHDKRFDLLAEKLLNHDERLENIEQNMATKEDIHGINNILDVIVGYVKKNDREISFMGQKLNRVEDDVAKIKPLVGLK